MKFYENKTIWIIGGTTGIGHELSKFFAKIPNCTPVVSGRSITDDINQNTIKLDVTKPDDFKNATSKILEKHQKVDIIIFCAGIYEPMNIENFQPENAHNILQTNLVAMVNFIEVLPSFFNKCQQIAIISSVAGYFGMPNSLFYGASKAGLSHLTESLAIELKKQKIDVKLINPGFVQTRLTQKNSFKMPFIISPEKAAKIIAKKLPKNRFEIAFPLTFVLILKALKAFPFCLRKKLF